MVVCEKNKEENWSNFKPKQKVLYTVNLSQLYMATLFFFLVYGDETMGQSGLTA